MGTAKGLRSIVSGVLCIKNQSITVQDPCRMPWIIRVKQNSFFIFSYQTLLSASELNLTLVNESHNILQKRLYILKLVTVSIEVTKGFHIENKCNIMVGLWSLFENFSIEGILCLHIEAKEWYCFYRAAKRSAYRENVILCMKKHADSVIIFEMTAISKLYRK